MSRAPRMLRLAHTQQTGRPGARSWSAHVSTGTPDREPTRPTSRRRPGDRRCRTGRADARDVGRRRRTPPHARALARCGELDYLHGDPATGRRHLEQTLAVARLVGDPHCCMVLRQVALFAADQLRDRMALKRFVPATSVFK